MINIDQAIEQSKYKSNISDGGSACFDFGDVVLIKYFCPDKYLENGELIRDEESIMEGVNKKAESGVNTPKHLAFKWVTEGEDDICYVLQEKCRGINCASIGKHGVSFDEMCSSLKSVLNIPFEHYKKLIWDGCQLYEMGHEARNRNIFYDVETGFWFIDFLDYNKEKAFDPLDPVKIFTALKNVIPTPIQIASTMRYGVELSEEQETKEKLLRYSIEAKTIAAIKSVLPVFEKYEKFFLIDELDDYKEFLKKEGIVAKNLLEVQEEDYVVYDELYKIVLNVILDNVAKKGKSFRQIKLYDIESKAKLFGLLKFWQVHKDNDLDPEEFSDDEEYEYAVSKSFTHKMLEDIMKELTLLEQNENIKEFLKEAQQKLKGKTK